MRKENGRSGDTEQTKEERYGDAVNSQFREIFLV